MTRQLALARAPLLRGHGAASPDALRGVRWPDWVADGTSALGDLLTEVDQAIVVGYSMGALVALALAADSPASIDSLILAAPILQINSVFAPGRPLSFLAPLAARWRPRWDLSMDYADAAFKKDIDNYSWAPADAILSVLDMSRTIRQRLSQVRAPTLVIQSRNDSVCALESVEILERGLGTTPDERRVVWFEKTEHDLFRDCEGAAVVRAAVDYVRERMTGAEGPRPST